MGRPSPVTGRILGLDGIRAYAVITVVILHLQLFIQWYYESSPLYSLIWHGVEIFFVLSGFLITHLLIRERKKFGNIDMKKFWVRRALRIFPLFYLFILCVVLIGFFLDTNTSLKQILISAIYGFNFVPKSEYNIMLGHTWSLAVEEHFYLIWPPVLILMLKKTRSLQKILVVLTIFFIGLELINNHLMYETGIDSEYFVERWTTSAAVYLLAGCMGGVFIHTEKWEKTFATSRLNILLTMLFFSGFFIDFWFSGHPIIVRDFRIIGILAGILWVVANQDSLLVRAMEWAPIRYIGEVSYGIYIWQGFYLATGSYRAPGQEWPLSDSLLGVLLLVITVPISYHLYEKIFLDMKKKFQRVSMVNESE